MQKSYIVQIQLIGLDLSICIYAQIFWKKQARQYLENHIDDIGTEY